jgi:hypothetical protein
VILGFSSSARAPVTTPAPSVRVVAASSLLEEIVIEHDSLAGARALHVKDPVSHRAATFLSAHRSQNSFP